MNLFVVGMHRSGTSMLTALLNMAGAAVGDPSTLTGSGQWNRKGFWEQNGVRAVNEGLLEATGADWDRPLRFSLESVAEDRLEQLRDAARVELSRFEGVNDWVLKDPRFCLTLPFWCELVSRPVVVMPLRNPLEVAYSLFARNNIPVPIGIALWEWYLLSAVQHVREIPQLLVDHAALMAEPVESMGKLIRQLSGLGCLDLVEPNPEEVLAFVDPKLRNANFSDRQLDLYLLPSQLEVWQTVKTGDISGLAGRKVSPASMAALQGYEAMEAGISRLKEMEREWQRPADVGTSRKTNRSDR